MLWITAYRDQLAAIVTYWTVQNCFIDFCFVPELLPKVHKVYNDLHHNIIKFFKTVNWLYILWNISDLKPCLSNVNIQDKYHKHLLSYSFC